MGAEYEKVGREIEGSWAALTAAFGGARDPGHKQLSLQWDKGPADMADPAAVAGALEQGIRETWATTLRLNARDDNLNAMASIAKGGGGDLEAQSSRLRTHRASEMCSHAIHVVASAGMFGVAMDAFDNAADVGGPGWTGCETLARLARDAIEGPRRGWVESMDKEARLGRLARSPWWEASFDEGWSALGDRGRSWGTALAELARASALWPKLAGACQRVATLSLPKWREGIGSVEHFGRELASSLGYMKIAGGALDRGFWGALPFEVRLGMALGVHGESKLGAWCCERVIEDGIAQNRLPEVVAGIWCGLERPRIDMLEARVKGGGMEGFEAGMAKRLSGSEAIMTWHYLESDWKDKRAKWARTMCASLKIAEPSRSEGGAEDWIQLMQSLHAMRQAQQIKEDLAAAKKAAGGAATKKAPGAKKSRL